MPFDQADDNGVNGDVGIVIVNNMLLTGFDAPIEQVMYLDKVVVAHGLLQAIARVNRVGGKSKEKGFVVDYVGIGHHLKKALDTYDEREQKELTEALSFPEDELRELQASHAAIKAFLTAQGLQDLSDHDAFFDVFYDEDVRFAFMALFKIFTKNLNLVFPARQALDHMADYQALVAINELAAKHFRDERLSMKGIPPKLRQITDAYLMSQGIDVKVKSISILDPDFQTTVKKHDRTRTKAAEIEHAVRNHLDVELDDDPELQASFAEALAKILQDFADNWAKIYEELEKLRQRIISASQEPTYGLSKKKQMPFFRMLRKEIFGLSPEADGMAVQDVASPALGWTPESQISALVALTQHVYAEIEKELRLTGFWESIPARNKLVADLQKTLLQPDFVHLPNLAANRKHIISRMMEIAEKNNDFIQYAGE